LRPNTSNTALNFTISLYQKALHQGFVHTALNSACIEKALSAPATIRDNPFQTRKCACAIESGIYVSTLMILKLVVLLTRSKLSSKCYAMACRVETRIVGINCAQATFLVSSYCRLSLCHLYVAFFDLVPIFKDLVYQESFFG